MPGLNVAEIARVIWEAGPTPDHPSVKWSNLIPGEYGHARAMAAAQAVVRFLTDRSEASR